MPGSGPVGVGFVGTGMISNAYLENLTRYPDVRVVILGDLDQDRAQTQATTYGVAEWGSTEDVLAHPAVEVVVNLTIPAVHAQIASAAIAAGKHVWSEKPISLDRESARALLDQAAAAGLLVGVAPDTVLGPGVQTARRAIAEGRIGQPLSAQTVIQYPGPDLFHPNPEFLFAKGAGPLFDMGPYYLTTLVHVFGSVQRVAAFGSQSRATRLVQTGDRIGTEFPIEVPTQVAAIAEFTDGGISSSTFSFDSAMVKMGYVEISGTEGTLLVPDPNYFEGEVTITHAPAFEAIREPVAWQTVPLTGVVSGRGLGVLDLARCVRNAGTPIASGELGFHVLDAMLAIDESITSRQLVELTSSVENVPLVPAELDPYASTL